LKACGSVDLPTLLFSARQHFQNLDCYQSAAFEYDQLEESEEVVLYQEIAAERVIFCEGPDVMSNPYFKNLPFKLVKGEVLDVKTTLSDARIVNRSVFMLPRHGIFKVGSTYDHSELNHEPTEAGKQNILDRMEKIFLSKYEVVGHKAGVRPATYDRRPLIGLEGNFGRVGIFNGFGAKGVSLVPFFATQFVNYLLGKENLHEGVSLERVKDRK
jgi:glycine/D-amino acid oxidase-like deaminating enzyme